MKRILVAAAVALCMSAAVSADVIWSNPNGSAQDYDWANGYNTDSNKFGSPSWFGGNNLYFLGSNFPASADDADTADSVSDTMNVDLTAHPEKKFLNITIFEFGDYTVTGGAGNSVSADLGMSATVGGHPQSPFADNFLYGSVGDSGGTVAWDGSATLLMDSAVPDVTSLHLTVSNTVVALSDGAGGTASIVGNFVLVGIAITVIPEPTALSFLALGCLAVLRRRRA